MKTTTLTENPELLKYFSTLSSAAELLALNLDNVIKICYAYCMRKRDPKKQKVWQAAWYQRHKEEQKKRVKTRAKETAVWFRELKRTLSCSRCAENETECLEFHHKDPSMKTKTLSQISRWGWSKKRIIEEIEKCEVLCANCHRKEHVRIRSSTG